MTRKEDKRRMSKRTKNVDEPGTEPPKKSKTKKLVVGGVTLLLLFAGCSAVTGGETGSDTSAPSEAQSTAPETVEESPEATPVTPTETEETSNVEEQTLSVTSTGPVSVTYGPLGSVSTVDASGSWSTVVEVDPSDIETLTSLTVQDMSGEATAESTCQIIGSDGTVIDEATSTGAYSIATCTSELSLW